MFGICFFPPGSLRIWYENFNEILVSCRFSCLGICLWLASQAYGELKALSDSENVEIHLRKLGIRLIFFHPQNYVLWNWLASLICLILFLHLDNLLRLLHFFGWYHLCSSVIGIACYVILVWNCRRWWKRHVFGYHGHINGCLCMVDMAIYLIFFWEWSEIFKYWAVVECQLQ